MIDLEFELREAMRTATNDLVARPDLLAALPSVSRRRHNVAIPLTAAAAVVVVAATGVLLTGHVTGGRGGGRLADGGIGNRSTSVESFFGAWGPTRGNRATDTEYLHKLASEWATPAGRGRVAGFSPLVNPQGELRVLWAADTPAGPAAVAAQDESQVPGETDVVIGMFAPGPADAPRLIQRLNVVGGFDDDPLSGIPDPDGFVLSPDPAGRYVVVVPADQGATVRISASHKDVNGKATRAPVGVSVRDGSAILDLGKRHVPGDEVVQVVSNGKTVVDSPITATLAPQPADPDNVVADWGVNGMSIGGSRVDGFRPGEERSAWIKARGADSAQPTFSAPWGGPIAATPDGGRAFAEQLWLPGEPAHTLVLQEARGDSKHPWGDPAIVSDNVQVPGDRPLFASRLRHAQGWFVGSGPGITLAAWREAGHGWTRLQPTPAALLDSDATSIELEFSDGTRAVVNG